MKLFRTFCYGLTLTAAVLALVGFSTSNVVMAADTVSFYNDVRPIFQRHCHGCHQPAKPSGRYVMTDFDSLLAGGETELAAVTGGDPLDSYLLDVIEPNDDGEAEMPKGKPALAKAEINTIRRWIEAGAEDDTPASAKQRYTAENPPVYVQTPVITAIDFSPDGELLAVAGYHEVLLHAIDGKKPIARLVGMSERIESIAFSPDGTQLAASGGSPGRMGEVQVWNFDDNSLALSFPVTYDTVYGVSWSPDGKLVGFGCADTTLRCINVKEGKQVLFQGAHDDWVLDTVFSVDGKHIISAGRDMSLKLIVVETERFVDNITSITPGALKGGIHAVARHPERNELLVGGADGIPKTYRMEREVQRRIGDDSNLLREFPSIPGRIFDVAYSPDGSHFVAGSSLDGKGYLYIYESPQDTLETPEDIKKIQSKVSTSRSDEERKKLDEYHHAGAKLAHKIEGDIGGLFAVAYHPGGDRIAAAGMDGKIRIYNAATGELQREFIPIPLAPKTASK